MKKTMMSQISCHVIYYFYTPSTSKTKGIMVSQNKHYVLRVVSYLKNRRQRVPIKNKFSSLKEVIAGVPQGSIDGALLFELFINDLFLFICFSTLSNYADDNNLFNTGTDIQLINQMLFPTLGQ